MPIFNFSDEDALGKVASVDTTNVIVDVENVDQLKRLQVNHLAVLQSSKPGQHLIGLITQVTRKRSIGDIVDDGISEQTSELNLCKIALIGTMLDRDGKRENVFRRTLESVPEIDANCFSLEGDNLTNFMRTLSSVSADGNALTLGKYTLDDHAVAYLNGNKFFQRHAFIGGSTGSGKSWTTARIIEQMAGLSTANAIVFDLHGEYSPLVGQGIQHFKVAGPADVESTRTIDDGVLYLPYWLLSYEALVAMFVDRSDQNAPNQAMIMSREINQAKRKYLEDGDHKEILAHFTVDSPVPFDLDVLMSRLNEINVEMVPGATAGKEKQGDFFGKLARMISRLENKISDRRLGFMFKGGKDILDFTWLEKFTTAVLGSSGENGKAGIKVINFSEVPSDVLPLIVSLVARVTFSVQQWTPSELRHPIALLCDEAHLYMPQRNMAESADDISLDIFERIAKEGRKYGVSLVVISQRPSEVNKTMLSQCSNFVSMRLTNAEDQTVIKRLLPDSLGGFSDILPTLDTGEALVVGDASLLPSRIRIDEPINKPNSGTVNFWDEWQNPVKDNRLVVAVDNWRKQNIQ
ncbi:ATP-binding protein [Achromobacter xylosoxidans]|uniref:ATP-binding protein n=1 Tax=Alcaligenes xylosoxydans xylosoxydans TaxID=85698 RepID=UPI0003D606C7|nr:ATP-binding protein [Achromobacter xylosoxidans]AHC47650.1 Bipolar DNA helicase [Achromobacter xylosoxidans NBRC 15126 = ATCC 27061]MCH1988882.1 ATP-binding protein [Achromobacter xylosoxidans]MCH1995608.1 ATP-binding protein [Achromobacter xylosoxidans]MCH4587270.1 ATP-binding protein [Achromobacter xylosoxidans]NYS12267.1 ATP-binding protein [Achromobacter xylosoxidans]